MSTAGAGSSSKRTASRATASRTSALGHSFLCSGERRIINVDFRGHGRSSHLSEPFALHDAVSDVIAVLDELGIERAVWCGLSIGGMVALRAALEHPQRVAGLILLDAALGGDGRDV